MDIFLHTNGNLLTAEIIDELIRSGLTWLSLSIDAATEETYRVVRGRGFDNVLANAHKVLEARRRAGSPFPFVRVSFVAIPETVYQMQDFHAYWKPHVEMVEFQDYVCVNPIGIENRPYIADSDLFELIPPENCPQPFYRMGISAGGVVGPCCSSYGQLEEINLGQIGETTIEELWRGHKMRAIRAQHTKPEGPSGLKTCSQCIRQNYRFKYYDRDFRP